MIKWEKFKWVIEQVKQIKKKSAPFATLGTKLIIRSLITLSAGNIALYLIFPKGMLIEEFKVTNGELSIFTLIIAVIVIFIGLGMILFEAYNYKKARKTGKLIINGMKEGFKEFPTDVLSYEEKNNSRDTIAVGIIEDLNSLEKQIKYYNSEKDIDLYNRFIFNNEIEKLYVCGISRVPFLVAYGYCLKGSVTLKYIERQHGTNKSFFLDDVNEKINIESHNREVSISPNGDIGIAIGFTTEIKKEHLPLILQDNTLFIKPSIDVSRLLIKNQDNLEEIVKEIQKIIDIYSGEKNCNKIHLFLAVQTSFAIELGRHFQEGMHKNWIIYNFDGSEGKYSWALQLSKEGIERI